ncbi:MarR family winged helix-turn-helix transcriptional regulator [Salinibacterium soli]|uniref:MarR family transcriptional regulator n=1 Tax=Antiquaquibacter soli TaxID=3064523 RepID=A0ABT9BHU9_9MICO|nr:MarR family transcriptional regulator [Protaetiibacter sp. WY-16]MDO7880603.1 MarR family transcriptional regulator [Protaetiibacter sp. WY-16]
MTASLSEQELATWRGFALMRRQLDLTLERRLQADAGISSADFAVLMSLQEEPARRLRAGRIGDLIGWEKSRVSHQLSRMEQRGLVTREECGDDARGVWIGITAEGSRAVLAALRDHTEAIRQYFFDLLSPEEQEVLRSVSFRVLDAINPPICQPEVDELAASA